ncbi:golgin subfamily A member 2 isoform X2 [Latimeria chalumnae]|uniref:golgin subfamily A member 2 isoform X2 n=1 Tax=Latimeria chalumnae TaxID=7897 RepID=UPI0006D9171D|nr:PREDICTED: golgin subfamily A member 2 isoform X2 [Latimeria chalumnae]|eukprot:XP_014341672.1 PREDICTED: golgin subfamily A member 2 isoform X2 [Latimeria chalumnae]
MADESRQSKLAAAKKKLKEYQQKNTPVGAAGAKRKKKVKGGSGPETPPSDRQSLSDSHSPENIQNILKVLVTDLNKLPNGIALPSLDKMKMYNADGDGNTMENRMITSTEGLRQLSEQLNGLVTQSASYINGESAVATIPTVKELESRNEELTVALDSCSNINKQLSTKIEELKEQNQDLSIKLEQEKRETEDKFAKEQGAMREQLQVHIQTIGILVQEKSELQTALNFTQQAAKQKAFEAEDLSRRLTASRQRISELERTLSSTSNQQKQFEKHNKELEKERDHLKLEMYKITKGIEEVRQQNSELTEQLHSRVSENSTMKLELEDLQKKLEMSELLIQQFTSQSELPDANQQLHTALEEKLQLETQLAELSESLQQLRAERDKYVQKLQDEGLMWQQRVQQLSAQVNGLLEDKEKYLTHIQELESSVMELQSKSVLQAQENAVIATREPEGPTQKELEFQEDLKRLQEEKETLQAQYQAQVRDNKQLSRLNQEQEERLLELEGTVQRYNEDAVDKQQILEDMQSDKVTISRALAQNRELKEQLAELQNGFVKLTNENMELVSALQSEQHVKKELAKKMGQLQEDQAQLKEKLDEKVVEAGVLLEQRDQYYSHLQQYIAAYQQLVAEREELQKQYLLQTQLMDRLQHEEVQGKVNIEMHQKELTQAKEQLVLLAKENEKLKVQLSGMETSTFPRVEGDGVECEQIVSEDVQKTAIAIPEDFESKEEMVAFLKSAVSQVERERDAMRQQLVQEQLQHRATVQQVMALRAELQQQQRQEGELLVTAAGLGSEMVPAGVHEALKAAMEKLQSRFMALMQEKVDLKERLEELEHRCIQLSGETDTIGEYIALYQSQRAILKQRHREKDEYISRLAQDKEEMKMKLAELQDLVMQLVGERNEWYEKYVAACQNPGSLTSETNWNAASTDNPMELNATDREEMPEVSLSDEPKQEMAVQQSQHALGGKAPQPGAQGLPSEDHTAKQIMQLLQEIQNPAARPSAFLGDSPCIPFFYEADERGEWP